MFAGFSGHGNSIHLQENYKKNPWKFKVTVIPMVIDVLGTILKGLVERLEVLEIRGQEETMLTRVLLRLARILRRVMESGCQSNTWVKPSANTDVKISKRSTPSLPLLPGPLWPGVVAPDKAMG